MMKKSLLLISVIFVMVFCTACGKADISGTYKGAASGTSDQYTLELMSDGTCTLEDIRTVSAGLGKGSEEVTENFTGTWSETDDKNIYKIVLSDWPGTLYGEITESGMIVTSDADWWSNTTFTKE